MSSGSLASFARQVVVVLKDSRLWMLVFPFLLLVILIVLLASPRFVPVLIFPLGLIASFIMSRIDRLPVIGEPPSLNNLTERILVPAAAGILLIPGPEVLTRIWLMPWHWFHTSSENPSCAFLMSGAAWSWFGFVVCGALLAALTRERSTFAAIV